MSVVSALAESGVLARLNPHWRIGVADDGGSFTAESTWGFSQVIGPRVAEYEPANARLADGATLAELRDAVMGAGRSSRAIDYLIWLQWLTRWGYVEFALRDGSAELAVVLPQRPSFGLALAPEPPPPDQPLDALACIRRADGRWLLESPLADARMRFTDFDALGAPLVRRALHALGFLAREHGDSRREALAQWEFHDLLFHFHSNAGWHMDPVGAMYPHIGEIEPLPALRPPWPGERVALPAAPEGAESFASVLERRRSVREYDETSPISRTDLGALLHRAARVRARFEVEVFNGAGRSAPFGLTSRPYPNGGASYELEIYPVVDRCEGIDPGLYHYDAGAHELVRIGGHTDKLRQLFAEAHTATANTAHPQVILVIAARFARVMWKYRAISYSVILRNTGALYQTLYLAATELGLSPCGLGTGSPALFAEATGLDPVVEGAVGEFILGGRPAPA